jgi:serine/threonine protein phosphatase 1
MNTSRFWVVGDVHNQYEALLELVSLIPTGEKIVFVGDLIHKGDAEGCAPVVSLVQDLVERGRAVCVRGNHDSTAGKGKFVDDEGDLTDEQRAWLKMLPLFVRYDDYLFVHGGIDSSVASVIDMMDLPEGDWTPEMVNAQVGKLSSKNRKRLEKCMYVRYVGHDGKMMAFGTETPESKYWAEDYDGRYGHVVFGHNPWARGPSLFSHATGIDIGAGESEMAATDASLFQGATLPENPIPNGFLCAFPIRDGILRPEEHLSVHIR